MGVTRTFEVIHRGDIIANHFRSTGSIEQQAVDQFVLSQAL